MANGFVLTWDPAKGHPRFKTEKMRVYWYRAGRSRSRPRQSGYTYRTLICAVGKAGILLCVAAATVPASDPEVEGLSPSPINGHIATTNARLVTDFGMADH